MSATQWAAQLRSLASGSTGSFSRWAAAKQHQHHQRSVVLFAATSYHSATHSVHCALGSVHCASVQRPVNGPAFGRVHPQQRSSDQRPTVLVSHTDSHTARLSLLKQRHGRPAMSTDRHRTASQAACVHQVCKTQQQQQTEIPDTQAEKFLSSERIYSIRETKGCFTHVTAVLQFFITRSNFGLFDVSNLSVLKFRLFFCSCNRGPMAAAAGGCWQRRPAQTGRVRYPLWPGRRRLSGSQSRRPGKVSRQLPQLRPSCELRPSSSVAGAAAAGMVWLCLSQGLR